VNLGLTPIHVIKPNIYLDNNNTNDNLLVSSQVLDPFYKILNNMSDNLLSRMTNNGRERPFSFGIGV